LIRDFFACDHVEPRELDVLLALGFRHFGTTFFRYDTQQNREGTVHVVPLRIDLNRFSPSTSQKRIMRRNRDLTVLFRPAEVDDRKESLFAVHKRRFKENVPESIYSFLSERPDTLPCPALECCLFQGDALLATGYFDTGEASVSSIYTFFDPAPELGRRSLGLYVLLRQIQYAREQGRAYLYHGYAYREPSFYDYKKNFKGLEYFDWAGRWLPFEKEGPADAG